MPRLELVIELDHPGDYFQILEGDEFSGSKVEMKPEGKNLRIKVEADNPKALITTIGSLIKQIRIIEQTSELVK